MDGIDTLISNLLRAERIPIKKLKDKLLKEIDYGMCERLDVYYQLHEAVIDSLERAGYLTKELTIIAQQVSLEPTQRRARG